MLSYAAYAIACSQVPCTVGLLLLLLCLFVAWLESGLPPDVLTVSKRSQA